MLNNFLNFYSNRSLPNYFIKKHKVFYNQNLNLYMGYCEFEFKEFDIQMFNQMSIFFPDSLSPCTVKRKSEFLAGRYASQLVLSAIRKDYFYQKVEIGKFKEPIFPLNIIGSITHSENIAICIATQSKNVNFLGIDIEPIISKLDFFALHDKIYTYQELKIIKNSGIDYLLAATCIFSAKETIFKAFFYYLQNKIDFNNFKLYKAYTRGNTIIMKFRLEKEYSTFRREVLVKAKIYKKHVITCLIN
ncbi:MULTISPECIES: 4'-phosphopantetheinyl transferase family protein [Acinetobacter]|uniref:Enterobactin synthase component D n=4 Tax=Acinetobacter pittii TaxID=48296 RepID=A0AAE9S966_ACIPI|nr:MULTISPECIES: 4'-phosphopantetheinyl transferase superfamily protein [Acinetobacter calcoaceticus/baumannii complex]EXC26633.1 4'-phosphopantetheinyl transferase superfamily protein [Acinetobacter sp. 809848]EXE25669.1 4'-phosphopantetheinyl transferase superfamily protein [Acinetobacter sp. 907131]EXS16932.1 4'-phosphopantetheinyl transferase superfamily protein [Acinetobacter sp. 883425]MCM5532551.1 4'-phosphopantetheinyl transferase superfamily protein [Acinetobacter pittii]MCQ9382272.1 